MKSIPVVLLSVLLYGCLTDSGDKLPEPRAVSTILIKNVTIVGRTVSFTVVCSIPEPCWQFVRSEPSATGQSVTIKMFARRTTTDPCLQVLSSLDAPATITLSSAGSSHLDSGEMRAVRLIRR